MKALTIHQPWAHLIVAGVKRVENRGHPTHYRGPIYVHAGARAGAERQGWLDAIESLRARGYDVPGADELIYSAILGTVEIVDCVRYDAPILFGTCLEADPFAWGPWCWILANPQALARPIPCGGKQGLWERREKQDDLPLPPHAFPPA